MNEYVRIVDRIERAEEIQRYTENRCDTLEKENAELDMKRKTERKIFQGIVEKKNEQLNKAIGIIKRWYETNGSACIEPSQELIEVTEQFLEEIEK